MRRLLVALLGLFLTAATLQAATQTVVIINRTTGQNLSTLAVAADVAGEVWTGTGSEFLYVNNGGGAPITVTLKYGPGATVDGQVATNRTISVPAGQAMLIGPFPTVFYNDANGNMNISYSAVTSVKVLVLRLGT